MALANRNTPERISTLLSALPKPKTSVVTYANAANNTLVVGDLLGGMIDRDCNGGARTDTLPTAAQIVAAIPGADVGQTLDVLVRNTTGSAVSITIAAGAGGTTKGTMTIAQLNLKFLRIRLTNVTPGSEAYDLYSLGTLVF